MPFYVFFIDGAYCIEHEPIEQVRALENLYNILKNDVKASDPSILQLKDLSINDSTGAIEFQASKTWFQHILMDVILANGWDIRPETPHPTYSLPPEIYMFYLQPHELR